jgi:hypothetical protein
VIDPNDTLIDMVDIQLYGEDGSIRQMLTGYRQPHSYLLHYGRISTCNRASAITC